MHDANGDGPEGCTGWEPFSVPFGSRSTHCTRRRLLALSAACSTLPCHKCAHRRFTVLPQGTISSCGDAIQGGHASSSPYIRSVTSYGVLRVAEAFWPSSIWPHQGAHIYNYLWHIFTTIYESVSFESWQLSPRAILDTDAFGNFPSTFKLASSVQARTLDAPVIYASPSGTVK